MLLLLLLATLCTSEIQKLNFTFSENAKNDFCTPTTTIQKKNSDMVRIHTYNAKQGILIFRLIEL